MRKEALILVALAALCALADAILSPGASLPFAVQYAEPATIAAAAAALSALTGAGSALFGSDPPKNAAGQAPGAQLPNFQGQVPALSASQGAPALMQQYLTQLAASQGGGRPSMRRRPTAAAPMTPGAQGGMPGAPGGAPGAPGGAGGPGMADIAGLLQDLYRNMNAGAGG